MNNLLKSNKYSRCNFLFASGFVSLLLLLAAIFAQFFIPCEAESMLLAEVPTGKQTFIIRQGVEKVGDLSIEIIRLKSGYRVFAKSRARMVVLGFSRNAESSEVYTVDDNLIIRDFDVKQMIDEKRVNSTGVLKAGYYQVSALTGDKKTEKRLKFSEPVYPSPLINLVSMFLCEKKKECEFSFFDPEAIKIKKVSVSYVGEEKEGNLKLLHYKNDLYPIVDNDVWLDIKGKTVRESVRRGLIDTISY